MRNDEHCYNDERFYLFLINFLRKVVTKFFTFLLKEPKVYTSNPSIVKSKFTAETNGLMSGGWTNNVIDMQHQCIVDDQHTCDIGNVSEIDDPIFYVI